MAQDGETFTIEQYTEFLSLAPTDLLVQVGNRMVADLHCAFYDDDAEAITVIGFLLSMLTTEHDLRQIEPLWRKAQRFAIRNSETFKEVGKIAACIGAGAILGISLDNS